MVKHSPLEIFYIEFFPLGCWGGGQLSLVGVFHLEHNLWNGNLK